MGKQFKKISSGHQDFIRQQKLFFVATAAPEGRVNVSPKGLNHLHIIGPNQVVWLNLTGSGNETAAHLQISNRMTLMFCSFDQDPIDPSPLWPGHRLPRTGAGIQPIHRRIPRRYWGPPNCIDGC